MKPFSWPQAFRWLRRLVVAALVVYWLLLAVSTHLPSDSAGKPLYNDKLAHFTAYAGLSFLLNWSIQRRHPVLWKGVLVVAIGVLYGAVDEFTQRWSPGRRPDWNDWFADLWGVLAGSLGYLYSLRYCRRWWRESRTPEQEGPSVASSRLANGHSPAPGSRVEESLA